MVIGEQGEVTPTTDEIAGAGSTGSQEVKRDEVCIELHGVEIVEISCVFRLYFSLHIPFLLELERDQGHVLVGVPSTSVFCAERKYRARSQTRPFGLPWTIPAPTTVGGGGSLRS